MGLKLYVSRGDKILIGNEVVGEVLTHNSDKVRIEWHAPRDIEIHTVFKDSSKQFKNAKKVTRRKNSLLPEKDASADPLSDDFDPANPSPFNR